MVFLELMLNYLVIPCSVPAVNLTLVLRSVHNAYLYLSPSVDINLLNI